MALFRTWLVVNESANDDLRNLANSLGVWAKFDFTARPSVTLSLRGDTAVLSTPSPRDLFEKVLYASQTAKKRVTAMSTASAADLRRINRRVFFAATMHIRVTCFSARSGSEDAPYFRRMVELEYLAAELQGGFDAGGTEVIDAAVPEGDALFLEPLALTLEDGGVQRLLGDRARPLAAINGVVLPPVRDEYAGTYFEPALRQARAVLARQLGAATPGPSQPSGLHVWRMLDDPYLRDVLLDGGSIGVEQSDGEPTAVTVNVWGQGVQSQPLADYRACGLLAPASALGPSWAPRLADALAADVLDASPSHPTLRTAGAAVDWRTTALPRPFDAGGRELGSWQRINDLGARLKSRETSDSVALLQEEGTVSVASASGVAPRSRPGRTRVRPPSVAMPLVGRGGCRMANGAARFSQAGIGRCPSVCRRSRTGVGGRRAVRYRPAADRPEVLYPAKSSMDDVLRWRLTVPIGTVFKPNARIRLDDKFSKLDRGYQLAS